MLQFFRKHQKYFFVFTTIIIVTSFAFFGSYQAFSPGLGGGGGGGSDEVVCEAVDGTPVKKSYMDHMTRFLEREEWMQSTKLFDANYLNDGVISKDIFAGGLAAVMCERFGELYEVELAQKQEREASYKPYRHPFLPMANAEGVWALFAPELPVKLAAFQAEPSFENKVDLFLAERQFPPAFLTQMMRYQEQDNPRAPRDPRLARDIVSLFGYHDHTEWFGEAFVESVANVVINGAAIAKDKGYRVSKQEALTEIQRKSQKTYEAIVENMELPVANGQEFFQVYLRQKGLDEATAICLMQDVMLFRRMMQEAGSAALVDALPLEQFYGYAHERAVVDVVQMAPELRFKNDEEAAQFASYVEAVGAGGAAIPLDYASIETVEKRAPELVGRHYRLYVGQVSKEALQAKVGVKETWAWEEAHFTQLSRRFPELDLKVGTPFERLEQVENRAKIDAYARAQIVEEHPEWVEEAVKVADLKETELFLTAKSENEPLKGISDLPAFAQALGSDDEIIGYTQDEQNYYRVLVDERSESKEIMPYKKAKQLGVLAAHPTKRYSFSEYLAAYRDEAPTGELAKQWVIERNEKQITRSTESFIKLDAVLAGGDAYSSVEVDENAGPYAYRLKEVFVDTGVPMQKWIEAQELLAEEMRGHVFTEVVGQLCSKNLSL